MYKINIRGGDFGSNWKVIGLITDSQLKKIFRLLEQSKNYKLESLIKIERNYTAKDIIKILKKDVKPKGLNY